MKKYLVSAFMLAVVSVGFYSCDEKGAIAPEIEPQPLFTELTVDMPVTRTTYTDNGASGMGCAWEAGDKMTIIAVEKSSYNGMPGSKAEFTAGSAGKYSVFSGTYTFSDVNAGKYLCIYPALETNEVKNWKSTYGVVDSDIFTTSSIGVFYDKLYQTASGNSDHLKYYDFMVGEVSIADGKATATLSKQMAVLKLVLTNTKNFSVRNSSYHLDQIQLENLTGNTPNNVFYNQSSGDYSMETMAGVTSSSKLSYSAYYFQNDFAPVDYKYVLYLPIAPFNMANGTKFNIQLIFQNPDPEVDDPVTYKGEIELSSDLSVEAGKIYTITKTLTNKWYDSH